MTTITRTSKPLTSRRAFITRLVSGVLVINVLVLGIAAVSLLHTRQQHVERSAISTENLAQSLGQTIANIFDKADVALLAVVDEAEKQIARGGINGAELNAYIARQKARIPELDNMRLANGQGDVLYGTGLVSGPPVNVADRDYFTSVRTSPPGVLFLAKPVVGRFTQKWVLNVSRRVNHPDGTFAGVAFATIPVDYFIRLFSSFDLGTSGIINLRAGDLSVIARFPEPKGEGSSVGITAVSRDLRHLIQSGRKSATYTALSTIDHIERIFSFHKVSHYPLYIIVGRASRDYLDEWWQEASKTVALLVVFIVGTVAAATVICRNRLRELRSEDELARYRENLEKMVQERTAELEIRNQQLEEAQRIAHLGSWRVDHLTGRLHWSDEIYRIFGMESGAIGPVYQDFLDRIHPDDRHMVDAAFTESARSQTAYSVSFRIVRPDGSIRHMQAQGETSFDANAIPTYSLGTAQDITERLLAEDAIRASEERFRLLVHSTPEAIFVQVAGKFAYINPAGLHLFGAASSEQVIGQPVLDRIHHDYRETVKERIKQLNDERCDVPLIEEVFLKLDDTAFDVEVTAVPVSFDGHPGAIVYFHDITDRKRAEMALRESEERFRLAMEATSDGIWDWDFVGNTGYFSPGYYRLLGYEPDEIAMSFEMWATMIHPEDRDHVLSINREYAAGNIPSYQAEFRMEEKGGNWRWILARGMAVSRNDDGDVVRMIGTHVDITARKEAEVAVQESERGLRIALNAARMVTFAWDPVTDRMTLNGDFERIYGRPPFARADEGFAMVHPDDQPLHRATIERAAREGGGLHHGVPGHPSGQWGCGLD